MKDTLRIAAFFVAWVLYPLVTGTDAKSPTSARAAGPESAQEVTFDDIKFDMEKGGEFKRTFLTDKIRELDGKRIRIHGYILPTFKQKGITQLVLVRDNMECCFGPGAALYDCIMVEMVEGRSVEFTTRPVAAEGVFTVEERKGFDGEIVAIYHLDGYGVK